MTKGCVTHVEEHVQRWLVLFDLRIDDVRLLLRGGDRRLEFSRRTVLVRRSRILFWQFLFRRLDVRPQFRRLLGRRQIVFSIESISGMVQPATLAFVEVTALAEGVNPMKLWEHLLAAVVFALVGITVLGVCFKLMSKLSPFSIKKEIEEDQNVALAVIMGAVIIGMSIIIAAAIQG